MANTLTDLIPTLYKALDVVSRELTGFLPAVARNSSGVERAALNQSVKVPVAPAVSAADNTPGVTPPDTGDQTIGNVEMLITKSRHVPVRWNGEQTAGMVSAGTFDATLQQQFEQAFRTLTNEMEGDLADSYKSASRAYGTAGTAPFGTAADLSDAAGVRQVLDDNGAPQGDLQLVLGSAAMANIRGKQSVLFKMNEAGTDDLLRRGVLGMLEGFSVRNSAQVKAHTKGTGTGYLVNDATPPAIGDVAVTTDTGTGTIVAGDVVTLAGDTNKYIVGTALASNIVTLNKPGLRVASDDDDAITVGNSYRANVAFHRNAIQLATRLPFMPKGGDMADDAVVVIDPVTGLAFEIAIYRQYLQITYHVRIAWGVKAIKPEHIAVLMG
jgi:hypothetical protein